MSERRLGDTKYTPLLQHLQALPADQDTVTLPLAAIETIIGAALPPSAHTPGFWGSNSSLRSALYRAGWRATFERRRAVVTFTRR